VRVDVQVTEGNNLITDLTAKDFEIYDEGNKQPIVHFGRESEPLSLVLLLDVSGSMRKHVEQVASVARTALRFMRPRDKVAVMVFGRTSKVRLEFTGSMSAVADEIRRSAEGDESIGYATNINDALADTAKYMDEAADATGRRAVLILTDNLGLNEKHPDAKIIDDFHGANTVLNAIVVGKGERPGPPQTGIYRNPDFTPADVFTISEQTGGEAVKADKAGQAFSRMIERIRTRYSIHYNKPESAVSGYRSIEVRLTPEARFKYTEAALKYRRKYRVS
jgi:VWFA-related protein